MSHDPHGESEARRGRFAAIGGSAPSRSWQERDLLLPGRRVVAPIDQGTAAAEDPLVGLASPRSFEAEQYRALRHVVDGLSHGRSLRLIAVTSPTVGDGKTTTAINFAIALAQMPGRRVLLVDADLRRSTVGKRLGIGGSRLGLADALNDPTLVLTSVTQWRPRAKLWVLPAGRPSSAPYLTLLSNRLGGLLTEARRSFDWVVLDTPPLLPVADCRGFVGAVDAFLMVVAAHKTPRRLVADALAAIGREKTLGIVFNGDDRHASRRYRRHYYGYDVERPREESPSFWRDLVNRLRSA